MSDCEGKDEDGGDCAEEVDSQERDSGFFVSPSGHVLLCFKRFSESQKGLRMTNLRIKYHDVHRTKQCSE